ncbi:hypothetical protein GCM10017744_061360 [Streptomyces antimycoticus]
MRGMLAPEGMRGAQETWEGGSWGRGLGWKLMVRAWGEVRVWDVLLPGDVHVGCLVIG